jgi:hypothetical protein
MTEISPFALQHPEIATAYAHVMGSTTIPLDVQEILFPVWKYAVQSGIPRLEQCSLFMLTEMQWEWETFDVWHTHFKATAQWPYVWRQEDSNFPHIERYNATRQHRRARLRLLVHTLFHVATNIRLCSKTSENWMFHSESATSSAGCPVEEAIALQYADSMILNDWRTWPPFFPGDRTNVRMMRKT